MAKVKSVKFYDFVELKESRYTTFNVRFYDINEKLILIDFSNLISSTDTYSENSEYIVTSYSSYNNVKNYPYQTFHTANTNINLNLVQLGYAWAPATLHATSNDFLKIEFKFPPYISKIEILASYSNLAAIDTMDYDIEFNDGITKTYHFKSNGIFSTISDSAMGHYSWDQDVLDSLFSELQFDKSKQIYDSNIGLIETLDTNNFRNIPINSIETLKVLYEKPDNTILNCLISFDEKQTWKTFDGNTWITVSDTSGTNIIVNCMGIEMLNSLDKKKLIQGGFTGNLDFKYVMKTNDVNKTPSITKIYIEYK